MTFETAMKKAHKKLQKLTGPEQVALCLEETGKDWNKIDEKYKYGIIVKKEQYEKTITNDESRKAGTKHLIDMSGKQTVTRSRYVVLTKALTNFSDENVAFVMVDKI